MRLDVLAAMMMALVPGDDFGAGLPYADEPGDADRHPSFAPWGAGISRPDHLLCRRRPSLHTYSDRERIERAVAKRSRRQARRVALAR